MSEEQSVSEGRRQRNLAALLATREEATIEKLRLLASEAGLDKLRMVIQSLADLRHVRLMLGYYEQAKAIDKVSNDELLSVAHQERDAELDLDICRRELLAFTADIDTKIAEIQQIIDELIAAENKPKAHYYNSQTGEFKETSFAEIYEFHQSQGPPVDDDPAQ